MNDSWIRKNCESRLVALISQEDVELYLRLPRMFVQR